VRRTLPTVGGAPFLAIAATSLALAAPSWGATTFNVTSTADSPDASAADQVCLSVAGGCTIRAAIEQADNLAGVDEILIPPGTYAGTAAALTPATAMNITGTGGARQTTLTGYRLWMLSGGPVSIAGLAITGVTGNAGPVIVQGPAVTLTGVWIHDNVVTTSTARGGGVRVTSGSLTVARSAITGNQANGTMFGIGGGIAVDFTAGNVVVEATTIARNSVRGGAGVSTSGGFGGGISTQAPSLVLRHVTLIDNTATAVDQAQGGNLYLQTAAGGGVAVADSIITGGNANTQPDCGFGSGTVTVTGRNVYANAAPNCAFPAANLVAPPPVLTVLDDHGGSNGPTAAPLLGSPAIDAAGVCPLGGLDQRGAPAPAGAACDIGAAELGADLQVSMAVSSSSVAAGGQLTYVATAANAGPDDAPGSTLTVNPPGGSTVLLVAPSQGTCAGTVCSLGTVPAGGGASVTVVVAAPAAGTLQASANAASPVPDPTPADTAAASTVTTIVPAPSGGTTLPPPLLPPPKDTTPPALSSFGVKGPLKAGQSGRLRLTLSEAASVTIAVQSLTPGRRVNGKCDAKAKTGARCTITKPVGSLTVLLPAGARLFTFPAKIGKSTLKAGRRYRLTVSASDATGNRSKSLSTDVTLAGAKK
jgi:Domain of unknown function DUF11